MHFLRFLNLETKCNNSEGTLMGAFYALLKIFLSFLVLALCHTFIKYIIEVV